MDNTWEQDTYKHYKNFRNNLRRTNTIDSLYVIWNYIQNLQFRRTIDKEIQVHEQFTKCKNWPEKPILPWDLEILAREAIIWGTDSSSSVTLRNWNYLVTTKNKLRDLANFITQKHIDKNNFLKEILRISHRQFPWQSHYPKAKIVIRYYKIYNTLQIRNIIENRTGLSLMKLYMIWLRFIEFTSDKFTIEYPPSTELPNISENDILKFLNIYSINIKDLRIILNKELEINNAYEYRFSSLKKYPIIKANIVGIDKLIIPIRTHLFWRLTNGLYYDLYEESGFDKAYGDSFQAYIGEVIKAGCPNLRCIPEYQYSKNERTTDWIIRDGKTAVFIECKTKRLTEGAKTELDNLVLKGQIDIISDAVIQLYKNILAYKKGKYPNDISQDIDTIYPLVVTLEDWYFYGDKLYDLLRIAVKKKLTNKNMNLELITKYPFSVCSTGDFEEVVQILSKVSIFEFFSKKLFDEEKLLWDYHPYIHKCFHNEARAIKNLFHEDYVNLFKEEKELSL